MVKVIELLNDRARMVIQAVFPGSTSLATEVMLGSRVLSFLKHF